MKVLFTLPVRGLPQLPVGLNTDTGIHPGQTFMIESSEYYLEPGQTYGGQWGKHEKYIKVLCFVSGYQWEKKDWKYVKFKVVGRGRQRKRSR